MSRSKPVLGDVLICQTVSSHKGTVCPEERDSSLVMVYLGTVPNDTDPDAPNRMRRLGWARTVVYEVLLEFGTNHEDEAWAYRWNYEADSPKDAALAALRYASAMCKTVLMTDPSSRLLTLSVRAIRLGPIDDDGKPRHSEGVPFVEWSHDAGSLDELKQQLEEL